MSKTRDLKHFKEKNVARGFNAHATLFRLVLDKYPNKTEKSKDPNMNAVIDSIYHLLDNKFKKLKDEQN